MEATVMVVFAYFFFSAEAMKSQVNYFFLAIFFLHYINRSFVFPFRTKSNKKKMPLSILMMAVVFNCGNGYLNGFYLGVIEPTYPVEWFYDPKFVIGVTVFFCGMFINWQSDSILLNLRKPEETGYKIPKGGMYRWISCPNYFGECLEWTGWAIATWSLPGLAFTLWTTANLIPRAIANHKWYRQQFQDYPEARKAVIPYIW